MTAIRFDEMNQRANDLERQRRAVNKLAALIDQHRAAKKTPPHDLSHAYELAATELRRQERQFQ